MSGLVPSYERICWKKVHAITSSIAFLDGQLRKDFVFIRHDFGLYA